MKTVLVIQVEFPPAAGPGVQRGYEFVTRLRDFGYEPVVVTASEDIYRNYAAFQCPMDETRLKNIPKDLEIHRAPFGLIASIYARLISRLVQWHLYYFAQLLTYPDFWMLWLGAAVRRAKRIVASRPVDVIFITAPPPSLYLLAWALKKMTNKPVVLDLRDPWTQYCCYRFPSKLHYRVSQFVEKRVLRAVDHIISNTPTSRSNLLKWADFLSPDKVSYIPNGYNEKDWREAVDRDGIPLDSCNVVYAGKMGAAPVALQSSIGDSASKHIDYADKARGAGLLPKIWRKLRSSASSPSALVAKLERLPSFISHKLYIRFSYKARDFDYAVRSPASLLIAMNELLKERADLRGKIKFIHAGPQIAANRAYAASLGIGDAYEERGYLTYPEVTELIRNADALFLAMGVSASNDRLDTVSQKVYQYIASHQPVLALVPEGDTKDILEAAGTAIICDPDNIAEIKSGLLALVERRVELKPNDEFIRQFSRQRLTAQLAQIFDRLT